MNSDGPPNETTEDEMNIDEVRDFWNSSPLWTGESNREAGTVDFFEEHRATYYQDCFAGRMDERIFPSCDRDSKILDLGCGIGFWVIEFSKRGFSNIHGADLSESSIQLAQRRNALYNAGASFGVQNAESLSFPEASFDHVNCQGVLHHRPNTEAAVKEIARVLRSDGTASVSVYYKNVVLRNWKLFQPLIRLAGIAGAKLRGRGRENIYFQSTAEEIVRLYDGADNPVGKAYSRSEFSEILSPYFEIEDVYFHFFPARSLPIPLPHFIHALLDRFLPFMIYFNLRRV